VANKDINPKQWWPDVESLYEARLGSLLKVASKYIYNRDHAIDVVHDAFAKATTYFNDPKNKDRKVREQILVWLVIKACKRRNKESREIPYGDTRYFGAEAEHLDDAGV
jgi:DNA-directed RNA polymerase specialized sigma24 family protein